LGYNLGSSEETLADLPKKIAKYNICQINNKTIFEAFLRIYSEAYAAVETGGSAIMGDRIIKTLAKIIKKL